VKVRECETAVETSPEADAWDIVKSRMLISDAVARLAYRSYQAGACVTADDLVALYVRPSDPELKISGQGCSAF
jgi:hypothetical protein